ncbi:MAG TPA: serine/threonine-protein kinase [Sandaracinaceae bacterium LLY-WYZ-13_1]|nr:serine/threonine-protein kinase [Sandaracinaceae bacterium LLY-WYZ-13_1]
MNGIPEKIGRYEVDRLLGQGAMGYVYLGRDPELDRAVAIKTVRHLEDLEDARLEAFLERFRNEARAAARLHHPAIVAVYDVGEDEAMGPYLVFEYVAGSTLKQILRGRGPLAPDAAVKLGRQVAAALDTAHAAGVIHRDVKPDNILVSAVGDAKLADFGVARVPDAALTKEGQFLGTPCYAAPETLESGRYGAHTDLFSFAAVLYEAITAVRAFPGDDAVSVAHKVVHDEPIPPSKASPEVGVPRDVDRVIMRGLSKDEGRRYGSAMALVDALASAYVGSGVLDRDPTGAQILPTPASEPPEPRTSSWAFGLVVLGLAAVGVAFVATFVDWNGDAGADPGVAPAPRDAGASAPDAAADGPVIELVDAGGARDAGAPDAGAGGVDSELPDVSEMSGFEREEAAKDQAARARAALEDGDLVRAEAALERARHYDPGISDIPELEAQIRELRTQGDPNAVP